MKPQKSVTTIPQGGVYRPHKDLMIKELLYKIKLISATSEEAKELINEFYYRFSGDIYKTAIQICSSRRDCSDMAEDVLQHTFIIASKKLSDFTIDDSIPNEEMRFVILAWLGRIANIHYLQYLEKFEIDNKYINDMNLNEVYILPDVDNDIELPVTAEAQKLKNLVDTLSERDQEIIMTYVLYDCIKTGNHLPDDEMKKLCNKYNTNSSNIRQIKKRIIQKIINLNLFLN